MNGNTERTSVSTTDSSQAMDNSYPKPLSGHEEIDEKQSEIESYLADENDDEIS